MELFAPILSAFFYHCVLMRAYSVQKTMGLCASEPAVNGIEEVAGSTPLEKSIAEKLRQRHSTGEHKKSLPR